VLGLVASCRFEAGRYGSDATGAGDDVVGDMMVDAAPPLSCTLLLGSDHSCARRTADQSIWCVGDNQLGQLGRGGAIGGFSTAIMQVDLGGPVESAANRFNHTCAVMPDGTAKCWGQNDRGQLGDATYNSSTAPLTVMNLASVVEIGVARTYTCARRSNGSITCWGDNASGQLGDGTVNPRTVPATSVTGLFAPPNVLALGASHGCTQLENGNGACWGVNTYGQLGDGTMMNRMQATPMPVTMVRQIAASGYSTSVAGGSTCALRMNGTIACWGSNDFGQLGNGAASATPSVNPVEVAGITGAVEIASGRYHVCARHGAGLVSCWGHNDGGQIGDGTQNIDRPAPVAVTLARPAVHIAGGGYHTCALLDDDSVYCWGYNAAGQLGDASQTTQTSPVVSGLCN
jgi:alpha-tubulin suppressor-like RCC1 family protein